MRQTGGAATIQAMEHRVVSPANGPVDPLSSREREVLVLAARGMTNTQIASRIGVTVHAVKFHLASIYRKLGVANRTEAAVRFLSDTGRPMPREAADEKAPE